MTDKNFETIATETLKNRPFSPLKNAILTELGDLASYLDSIAPEKAFKLSYIKDVIERDLHEDVKIMKNKDVTAYEHNIEGLRYKVTRTKALLFDLGYTEGTELTNPVWLLSMIEQELEHVRKLLSKEKKA